MVYKRSKTDIHSLPELRTFRTELRSHLTPAEASFWNLVKNSKLDGRKFRRQHSVGKYVLDFYCPSEKLGIERMGRFTLTTLPLPMIANANCFFNNLESWF